METDPLVVRRFHTEIGELLKSGYLGGSGKLFRLEQLAWQCHRELSGSQKTVCAGVAHFLDQAAKSQEGEAVTADAAASLCSAVNQPLSQCLDCLIGRDSGLTAETLLAALTNAYERWIAQQS